MQSGSEGPEPTQAAAASRKLRVYGTVTSTRGEPLSGARVTPLEHISAETQTDAQGSYEVLFSPKGRIAPFRFRLEGYQDALGRPAAVAGASRELRPAVQL